MVETNQRIGEYVKRLRGITLVAILLGSIIVPGVTSSSANAASNYSPHWVKNCIQVYSNVLKSFQSQCDQAYATAPGNWQKNCIQNYSQLYKSFLTECAQAYVPTGRTGSWTKNCTQVYNQAYKVFETKCAQAYILR